MSFGLGLFTIYVYLNEFVSLPEISDPDPRKKIGDGVLALEVDGSVSDLEPE